MRAVIAGESAAPARTAEDDPATGGGAAGDRPGAAPPAAGMASPSATRVEPPDDDPCRPDDALERDAVLGGRLDPDQPEAERVVLLSGSPSFHRASIVTAPPARS